VSFSGTVGGEIYKLKSERGASFLCCDFLEGRSVWCADELDFGFFR
jgi:hypothetical protein